MCSDRRDRKKLFDERTLNVSSKPERILKQLTCTTVADHRPIVLEVRIAATYFAQGHLRKQVHSILTWMTVLN